MSVTNDVLLPVSTPGWRRGFSNLLDHQHHQLWGTRKWLVQMLIWIILINGPVALFAIAAMTARGALGQAEAGEITPESIYMLELQIFFSFGVFCTAAGAVIAAQGAMIQEKQMGTAAWILSKPVSRSAFVLAKITAYATAFLALMMVVPTILFYVELYAFTGRLPALNDMLAALGVWSLSVLFYITLTIMLGAFFNSRGAVLGIPLGFMFAGNVLSSFVGNAAAFFPWLLSQVALALALGSSSPAPLPPTAVLPVIATILWTALFIGLAVWRFGKEEF